MKHQLYGHLRLISKTIQVKRTRHVGHCWRSKDELINDVILWNPTYELASVAQPATIYLHLLCTDTGLSLEDLPSAMDDRDRWRERYREREREREREKIRWWLCATVVNFLVLFLWNCIRNPKPVWMSWVCTQWWGFSSRDMRRSTEFGEYLPWQYSKFHSDFSPFWQNTLASHLVLFRNYLYFLVKKKTVQRI